MKRIIAVILSMLLICLALTGCGRSPNSSQGSGNPTNSTAKTADNSPGTSAAQPNQPKNLSESYTAYMQIKSDLLSRLTESLPESQPAAGLELLGISLVELYLMPMVAMGVDEAYAQNALAYLKATGVKYTADGNHYMLTYTGTDGVQTVCGVTYDPAKDAVISKITASGKEALTFEYTKTSYGYAAQYYFINDDGTGAVYKGTFYNGKDGILGMTEKVAARPASIIGSAEIPKDFPKDCAGWFEVNGNAGTGKAINGTTFNFTVPDKASN